MIEIVKQAACTRDAPHALISIASKLPSMGNIKINKHKNKRTMGNIKRNIRQQSCAGQALPSNRSEIMFPYDFTTNFNGEAF